MNNVSFSYQNRGYIPGIFQHRPGEFSYRPARIFNYDHPKISKSVKSAVNIAENTVKTVAKNISKLA